MLEVGYGSLVQLMQALRDYSAVLIGLAAIASLVLVVSRLLGSRGAGSDRPGLLTRAGTALAEAFTTNWQLTLLATTAFVLSVASGWTTWDGMRNFTGEPVLSLMVTFGIQGVMLIIAWLIGESFASGMGRRSGRRAEREAAGFWGHLEPLVGMVVGALCAIGLLAALANSIGAFDDIRAASSGSRNWATLADKALYAGVALLLLATLLINQRSDIVQPYLQSARVIARNAMLWVMFLACMATSVFFSFDSLFSAIFPQDERRRAADIRASRQVAGVVNDIGVLAQRRQAEEAEALFRSPGWGAYEKNLGALSHASQGAEQEIEQYFVERMEAHKSAMAAQQERIATAKSGQAGITSKKAILTDELARIKGERPALAGELADKKTELENRAKGIDAKRVEMMAEERGAEGTLKVGKGPVFRQRRGELDQLQDAYKIQEERVRDAQKRLQATDTRIAQIERELAAIDADLAKLRGEAETAEQRIQVAEAAKSGDSDMPKVDPARVRAAFERAHAEFRQEPTVERLGALAGQCTQLLNAMASTPATRDRVRGIDCDAKQATDAAARVFALNAGLVTFAGNCVGGARLPQSGGTDALLAFGRRCVQDSGLPSRDASDMAAKLSAIDLNRDDKAHRFVVTWNAFTDGNRLAYLALAIAIAIDGLVFMSGLFGANAVRSPLTDLEGRDDLTADQLEAAIDTTLHHTPDPRGTLAALLRSMHPVHAGDGYTSEIILDEHEPHLEEMRAVLVAGATIGAVRRVGADRSRYLVSTGLARYFAVAQKKSWKIRKADIDRKELVSVIGVALLPDPQGNAEIVLAEMHPISDAQGFAAETNPFRIENDPDGRRKRLILNTLGAGATIPNTVKRNDGDGRYFVSSDFYKTLLMMRAAAIPAFRPDAVRARYAPTGPDASRAQLPAPASEPARPLPSQTVQGVPRISGPLHPANETSSPHRPESPERPSEPQGAARPSVPSVPVRVAVSDGPPPLPVAARQGAGAPAFPAAGSHEPNLADDIRADIIQLGGLHAWSDREIAIARTLGAESEPEQALRRLSGRAPRLARLVGEAIDENRASLREAYDYLRARNSDAMYNQVLETVAIELDELMPILMLTPGGPYQQILDRLIYDLEAHAGEGQLPPADDILLARARAQVAALKSLADGAPDRYVRIVRIIDQYDERGAHAPAPMAKRSAG